MFAMIADTRLCGAAPGAVLRSQTVRYNRCNRPIRTHLLIGLLTLAAIAIPAESHASDLPALHVQGRHFVDDSGRVVILRGLNISGNSKVPPFHPGAGAADLDRVAALGMNAIRLLFIWEAYEPHPGQYRDDYLASLRKVAEMAAARGIYTIVDFHQDGFSRYCSRGTGAGFPAWTVTKRGTLAAPDNSVNSSKWPILMITDPIMHKSFTDFYADTNGARTAFLRTVDRVAMSLADVKGIAGYDLLNEPWGDEKTELAPLYEDMARVIRARHASAIIFVEGNITTNCGLDTGLPQPRYTGFAYAPHYYKPLTMILKGWRSSALPIDLAFRHMEGRAAEWNCPLFLGEFGVCANATNAEMYITALYDRIDAALASSTQWNLTPGWTPEYKDGWNGEDLCILDRQGKLRHNFVPRPYPRLTAGSPVSFTYTDSRGSAERSLTYTWVNRPELGATEIALPEMLFRTGTRVQVLTRGVSVQAIHDFNRRAIVCRSDYTGTISIRVFEPGTAVVAQGRRGILSR